MKGPQKAQKPKMNFRILSFLCFFVAKLITGL